MTRTQLAASKATAISRIATTTRTRRKTTATPSEATSEAHTAPASHAQIEARAHELFLARGAAEGHALDDWLRAEAELQSRGGHLNA